MGRRLGYVVILIAAAILLLFPPVARASGARVDAMGGLYGFLDDDEDWFINPAFLGGNQDKVLDLTYGTGRVDSRRSISQSNISGIEFLSDLKETLIGFAVDPLAPTQLYQTVPQSLLLTTVLPFPEKNPAGNAFAIQYARYLSSYSQENVGKALNMAGAPTSTTTQTIEMPSSVITILDGWKINRQLSMGFGYALRPEMLAQTSHTEIQYPTGDLGIKDQVYEDPQPLNTYQAGMVYRFSDKNALDLAATFEKRSGEYTYRENVDNPSSAPPLGPSSKTQKVYSLDFGQGTGRIGFRHDLTENTSLIFALTGQYSTEIQSKGQVTLLDAKNQDLELAGGFRTRTERWTLAGNARVAGQAVETVQNGDIPDLAGMVRTYFNLGGEYRTTSALCFRAGVSLDTLRDPYQDSATSSPSPTFQTTLGMGYTIDNFVLDLAVPILLADAQTTKDPLTGLPAEFTSSVRYQARFSISTRF